MPVDDNPTDECIIHGKKPTINIPQTMEGAQLKQIKLKINLYYNLNACPDSTCRQKSKCSNRKEENIMTVAAKGTIGCYKFSNRMV